MIRQTADCEHGNYCLCSIKNRQHCESNLGLVYGKTQHMYLEKTNVRQMLNRGKENDDMEWSLNSGAFNAIYSTFIELTVHLFASGLNNICIQM